MMSLRKSVMTWIESHTCYINGELCSSLILLNKLKNLFFLKNVPQKIVKCFHPTAFLNKVPVERSCSQKKKSLRHKKESRSLKSFTIYFWEMYLWQYIPNNQNFSNKIEAVQCNAALAITNAIKRNSRVRKFL